MQRDYQMRNSQWLGDLEYHRSTDDVSGGVLAVGVVGLDIELGVVPRLGGQGRLESGQERPAWSRGGWIDGCTRLTGTHTICIAHIMRLPAFWL